MMVRELYDALISVGCDNALARAAAEAVAPAEYVHELEAEVDELYRRVIELEAARQPVDARSRK